MARLFWDSEARPPGPLVRGHLLLFEQREAPSYPARTGLRLLVIVAVLEIVVGPRAHLLSWLGLDLAAGVRVPLLLAASILLARFWAKAKPGDVGFQPWRSWTLTEKLYFPQVVLLANGIFIAAYSTRLAPLARHSEAWRAAATLFAVQLLWGFYQEVNYRGMLQTELTRRLGNRWGPLAANLAYTFGPLHLYHFTSARSPAAIALVLGATFAIGLFFAFVFHRTRNVWLVGVFHGIGNAYINGAAAIAALVGHAP